MGTHTRKCVNCYKNSSLFDSLLYIVVFGILINYSLFNVKPKLTQHPIDLNRLLELFGDCVEKLLSKKID